MSNQIAQARPIGTQRCHRCGSLMFWDLFVVTGATFEAWHCPICGEIWDEQIQENRLHQPGLGRGRPPKWSRGESFGARNGRGRRQPINDR